MGNSESATGEMALHTVLGHELYAAGFTEPGLRDFWGEEIAAALERNNAAPAIHHCRGVLVAHGTSAAEPGATRLAVLALLFLLRERVEEEQLLGVLSAEAIALALDRGLLSRLPTEPHLGEVHAPLAITPYALPVGVPRGFRPGDENIYLISDHGTLTSAGPLAGDFVLGLGGAGRTLVSLTPREKVELAADIGTGCGIQALLLARHSTRVIATDISQRALELARMSAEINAEERIEFRAGSLLEPLHETVDLLVSNPPFVITPRADTIVKPSSEPAAEAVPNFDYRDGGMTGDRLVRTLFHSIPEALGPGGRSVCLANWEQTGDTSTSALDAGPETWIEEASTSAFVIEREVVDPVSYAETWIRDGGIVRGTPTWNAATAAWADDFSTRGVGRIVFGYVLYRKEESVAEAFRIRQRITSGQARNPQGISAFIETLIELNSWLHTATAADIASTRFTRSPDVVEHRHLTPGADDPSSITLEQGIGFGQVFELDTALSGLVSVADGSLTVGQTAQALAQLLEVNPTALEDQLIAQFRRLCAAGVLLPVTED